MSQSGKLYNVVHSIHCIYYVTLYNPVQLCTTLYIVTYPTINDSTRYVYKWIVSCPAGGLVCDKPTRGAEGVTKRFDLIIVRKANE